MTAVGTRNESTREAWLEGVLRQLPAGTRILDAGAGERKHRRYCGHLAYVSQDLAAYDGRGDGTGLQTGSWDRSGLDIVCDISSIPEPDGSFGAVMCIEVFEHLPDPLPAIREFRRLLARGGILVLTAPFCSLTHFAPYHFATGYNRYFHTRHLDENGFQVQDIVPNGNFFEYLAQEIRRLPQVASQYCGAAGGRLAMPEMEAMLAMLERLSAADGGSHELLCFGYHVLARKR